jgi:hypothetical protein
MGTYEMNNETELIKIHPNEIEIGDYIKDNNGRLWPVTRFFEDSIGVEERHRESSFDQPKSYVIPNIFIKDARRKIPKRARALIAFAPNTKHGNTIIKEIVTTKEDIIKEAKNYAFDSCYKSPLYDYEDVMIEIDGQRVK